MPKGFFRISDIEALDLDKLLRMTPPGFKKMLPGPKGATQKAYVRAILESQDVLKHYGIDTPMCLAHFIGQALVESDFLTAKEEGFYHTTTKGLRNYGKLKRKTDEELRPWLRLNAAGRVRLASYVYAGMGDNGPPESEDGWRYRGRGIIQLTHKRNYVKYGEELKKLGIDADLVGDPDLLTKDLKLSVAVAAAFFKINDLVKHAAANDVAKVSRGINLGDPNKAVEANHEAERIQWTHEALKFVSDPDAIVTGAGGGPVATDDALRMGAVHEDVAAIQRDLAALGYLLGTADGIFGAKTKRAVIAFQHEHGLPITGAVDNATRAAIAAALNEMTAPAPAAPPPVESLPAPSTEPAPEVTPPSVETAPAPQPTEPVPQAPEPPSVMEAAPAPLPEPAPEPAPQPSEATPVQPPIKTAPHAPEPMPPVAEVAPAPPAADAAPPSPDTSPEPAKPPETPPA